MRWLALLLAFVPLPAFAQEGITLRTSLLPESAWVGERVRLRIDVLAEDGWAQIPNLGDLHFPGAYVVRTESQGTRLSEGAATGQRYQLSMYPQREGRLEIPALPVRVVVKRWGASASEDEFTLVTPPASLDVRTPPGAEGIRGLVSSPALSARQAWSARPDTLQLGDAVSRTVTLVADDVSGMAFPPLEYGEQTGLGIYPGEPRVEDTTNRGSLQGERVETVTYVVERPGPQSIPVIRLSWWNLRTESLETIDLEGLNFVAVGAPAPEPVAASSKQPPVRTWPWLALPALVLVGAVVLLRRPFMEWRRKRRESEGRYFRDALRAIRSGDAGAALNALMRWLDRIQPGSKPARLDRFLERHGDQDARREADRLLDSFARGDRLDQGARLASAMGRARKNWHASLRRRQAAESVLPELNG